MQAFMEATASIAKALGGDAASETSSTHERTREETPSWGAGADGAQRKFDDRAKIESRVPRSNLPVFLHLTLGGKDS